MTTKVDLNTATSRNIRQNTGIPLELANDIVKYRRENGQWRHHDDLWQLKGMSKTYFATLFQKSYLGRQNRNQSVRRRGDPIATDRLDNPPDTRVGQRRRKYSEIGKGFSSKHSNFYCRARHRELSERGHLKEGGPASETVRFDNVNLTSNIDTVIILDKDGEKYRTAAQSVVIQSSTSGNKLLINCADNGPLRHEKNGSEKSEQQLSTKSKFWSRIRHKIRESPPPNDLLRPEVVNIHQGKASHSKSVVGNLGNDRGMQSEKETGKISRSRKSGSGCRLSQEKRKSINDWLNASSKTIEALFQTSQKIDTITNNLLPNVNKPNETEHEKKNEDKESKSNGKPVPDSKLDPNGNAVKEQMTSEYRCNVDRRRKHQKISRNKNGELISGKRENKSSKRKRHAESPHSHDESKKSKKYRTETKTVSETQEKPKQPSADQPGPSNTLDDKGDSSRRHQKKARQNLKDAGTHKTESRKNKTRKYYKSKRHRHGESDGPREKKHTRKDEDASKSCIVM